MAATEKSSSRKSTLRSDQYIAKAQTYSVSIVPRKMPASKPKVYNSCRPRPRSTAIKYAWSLYVTRCEGGLSRKVKKGSSLGRLQTEV